MDRPKNLTRRQALVLGGAGVAAGSLAACRGNREIKSEETGDFKARRFTHQDRNGRDGGPRRFEAEILGRDPLVLGPETSKEPAEHSRVENMFWADRLREHAHFFWLLMPGEDLSAHRDEAERFLADWQKRYERARDTKFDVQTYVAFNRDSIDLAKRMSDWKKRMAEAQASGKLQSLVWPSFFRNASAEADYFIKRLDGYNARTIEVDRKELIDFWAHDTAGHLAMIGHFLDPEETEHIGQALTMSKQWKKLRAEKPASENGTDPILKAEEEVIDFKTAVARGVEAGRIRSILRPIMLEHMRREAFRFVDELKRST